MAKDYSEVPDELLSVESEKEKPGSVHVFKKATNYKDATALFIDNGLFVELAIKLSKDFKRVLYYSPWQSGFPKSSNGSIGKGIEGIERVDYMFDHIRDIDIAIFPDVYYGDYQDYFRSVGIRVWGCGSAEFLETDRWRTRQYQKKAGMPVPETKRFVGLDALRAYLKTAEDKFVKVSKWRGDFETFHHVKYFTSEPILDKLEWSLGARKKIEEFIVEASVGEVESGYDGWVIDGKFPPIAMYGFEIKDAAYAAKIEEYEKIPKPIQWVNDKLVPVFKDAGSRGFFSTEVRFGKDKAPYLTDPCLRSGSPPSEVMMECYSNLPEIIYEGSAGTMVTPKPLAKYAAMAMMHSAWADGNWMPVDFKKSDRQWIKFRNLTIIDGRHYAVPLSSGLPEIGAVVGIGNTLNEAMERVKEVAKNVEGYILDIKIADFDPTLQTLDEAKKYGVGF